MGETIGPPESCFASSRRCERLVARAVSCIVLRGLCGDTTGPIDWLPQLDSLPQPGLFIETSLFQTSEVTARDHADDFALVDDR